MLIGTKRTRTFVVLVLLLLYDIVALANIIYRKGGKEALYNKKTSAFSKMQKDILPLIGSYVFFCMLKRGIIIFGTCCIT